TLFISHCPAPHRALHSFPTRRSSDLRCPSSTGGDTNADSVLCSRPGDSAEAWLRPAQGDLARSSGQPRTIRRGRAHAMHYWNSRSEEHTSELQSRFDLVCRLLLEKKK